MSWPIWLAAGLAALVALYGWLIATAPPPPDARALFGRLYAHRGLHDGNHTVFENSLNAFRLAAEQGYGIELDVQRTVDGVLVVHHDGTTGRVCGSNVTLHTTPYAALPPLPDGTPIPTLQAVLTLVAGRVPLMVEIKPDGGATANAAAACSALREYAGAYCIESFHPAAVQYFRKTAPAVFRGQLAMGGRRAADDVGRLVRFALKYLLVNCVGRPHFVSYQSEADRNLSMLCMKHLCRPPLAAWTLRTQSALNKARRDYQMFIFERFEPDQASPSTPPHPVQT